MSFENTVGQFLTAILPRLLTDKKFPGWPPDCFGLCLALMKRTGAYTKLLQDWPPDRSAGRTLENWTSTVRELGKAWGTAWRTQQPFDGLGAEWGQLCESFALRLNDVPSDRSLCEALMKLVAVADEASENVGAPADEEADNDFLLFAASQYLANAGTLCREIDCTRLTVLPRMHTPQNGLIDRSLSLYLSMRDPSEVTPKWFSPPFIQQDSINLLLIPWPLDVLPSQFRKVTSSATAELPEDFGYFTCDPPEPDVNLVELVSLLYRNANRRLGRIDGVILPELAITGQQFESIKEKLPPDCFLVSGVGGAAGASQRGTNEVRLSFPWLDEVVQKKHHPWKLNESQVVQYGLGAVLSPSLQWWERADFTDRCLNFISIGPDLVLCALVCEDLARPDPVADLVRTVAPNLVIALLMDGPQTKERWAARYATVLADDPGCSVLSLTSLGMAQLSRPQAGPSRSRVIALWKDAFVSATEIELPVGYDAVAVSLSIKYQEEYTADGRSDEISAAFPTLSGVHPIRVAEANKSR